MDSKKRAIIGALHGFVNQRAGMDPRNYGDYKSYRAESRSVTRDLHDARELLRAVSWRDSITGDDLEKAFRAFSGRLTCKIEPVYTSGNLNVIPGHLTGYKVALDYCTGQYFPTEYRKAVCAVLASALWDRKRADMPSKIVKDGQEFYPHCSGSANLQSAGDWIRDSFKREFGPRLASRYFD